jgi:hypothetical protein
MKFIRSTFPPTSIWWIFGLVCGDSTFANLRESADKNQLWQSLGWVSLVLVFAVSAGVTCLLIHPKELEKEEA